MTPLTPVHVQEELDRFGLGLTVEHFDDTTFTSEDAARAIGCELGQIAKSMCVLAAGQPVLVVASGEKTLSDVKLAGRFGVGRKKIKLADPDTCVALFGYPPGGVAPVAHRSSGITVLIDRSLSRWDTIYAAAGTPHHNFALSFDQLLTITGGEVADCVRD
jgi:prolyl-tRNA editing enzyme YbaK/EbsC (Cys-tRNA(Pro) deacylase)